MKWIFAIVVGFWWANISIANAQNDIRDICKRYPSTTTTFVYCRNAPTFIQQLSGLNIVNALRDSPLTGEIELYQNEINRERLDGEPDNELDRDAAWFQLVQDVFSGPVELASWGEQESSQWVMRAELRPDIPAINDFMKLLTVGFNIGKIELVPITPKAEESDEQQDVTPVNKFKLGEVIFRMGHPNHPVRIFIGLATEEIVIASSQATLLARIAPVPQDRTNRTLADNRKLVECLFHTKFEQTASDDLFFFVDMTQNWNQKLALFYPTVEARQRINATGFGEFLSYGGRVSLANPDFEIDVSLYIGNAAPRIGIHNVLNSLPLQQPVRSGIPQNVDFYYQLGVNVENLGQTITDFQNSQSFLRAFSNDIFFETLIGGLHDHLVVGMAASDDQAFTGAIDSYGWFSDEVTVQSSYPITRYFLQPGQSVVNVLLKNFPGGDQLVEKWAGAHAYRGLPDEFLAQMMNANNGTRFAPAFIENTIGTERYFAIVVDEDHLPKLLGDVSPELDQSPEVPLIWKAITQSSQPQLFIFFRNDALYRKLFFELASRDYGSKTWLDRIHTDPELMKTHQKRLENPDFDYRLNMHKAEQFDRWDRRKFRSHFTAGGIAVTQSDSGYHIRVLQIRK